MNVKYQTIFLLFMHVAFGTVNALLVKYVATFGCEVKSTSFINYIPYWHLRVL